METKDTVMQLMLKPTGYDGGRQEEQNVSMFVVTWSKINW